MSGSAVLIAVVACAGVCATGDLHAQPRGPAMRLSRSNEQKVEQPRVVLDEAARARKFAEMEAWLSRLPGRFRVDATLTTIGGPKRTEGAAVCGVFGKGPGVRCVVEGIHRNVSERDRGTLPLLYFAINAEALEIQLVMVDVKQVSAQSGALDGETVKFSDNWKVCHKVWTSCWATHEVAASAAGGLFMRISEDSWAQGTRVAPTPHLTNGGHTLELELHLHRESLRDSQAPLTAPRSGADSIK